MTVPKRLNIKSNLWWPGTPTTTPGRLETFLAPPTPPWIFYWVRQQLFTSPYTNPSVNALHFFSFQLNPTVGPTSPMQPRATHTTHRSLPQQTNKKSCLKKVIKKISCVLWQTRKAPWQCVKVAMALKQKQLNATIVIWRSVPNIPRVPSVPSVFPAYPAYHVNNNSSLNKTFTTKY